MPVRFSCPIHGKGVVIHVDTTKITRFLILNWCIVRIPAGEKKYGNPFLNISKGF